jgi:hypothetical protein
LGIESIRFIDVSDAILPNRGSWASGCAAGSSPAEESPVSSTPATNFVKFVSSAFQKLSPRALFFPNQDDFSVKLLFEPWDIRSVRSFRTSIRTDVMKIDPRLSF